MIGCDRCEEGVYLYGDAADAPLLTMFVREHRRCRFVPGGDVWNPEEAAYTEHATHGGGDDA